MEEIQDKNREGELLAEAKVYWRCSLKKSKVYLPIINSQQKRGLETSMTFLYCTTVKVRQTCFKLKEQYSEVANHFKTNIVNCNNLTKDDLVRVLIPDDFHEIQNLLALEYPGNRNCLYNSISILTCGNYFCVYNINWTLWKFSQPCRSKSLD